jgi:hypothetical protein
VRLSILAIIVGAAGTADAHAIAGNRLFPGTSAFDDPGTLDELAIETVTNRHPAADNNPVDDTSLAWSFARLLTPDIAIGADNSLIQRGRGGFETVTGQGVSHLSIKGLLYESDPHEILVSAALTWGIGGSGSRAVDAGQGNHLEPGLFFGKGFGDLRGDLSWLRPFAITGAISAESPLDRNYGAYGLAQGQQALVPIQVKDRETLHWGFSIQYSTLYMNPDFGLSAPKKEPLNQFIPLIEFAFDSPLGQRSAGTVNPGLAYVGDVYQVSAEALIPLNREGGSGVGARIQLLLFTDDIVPSLFGKPLLSQERVISTVDKYPGH